MDHIHSQASTIIRNTREMSQIDENVIRDNNMQHHDNTMEQRVKRFKPTKESIVMDIASSIDHIAKSVKSLSGNYSEILRINKVVVQHLRNIEKYEEELNTD